VGVTKPCVSWQLVGACGEGGGWGRGWPEPQLERREVDEVISRMYLSWLPSLARMGQWGTGTKDKPVDQVGKRAQLAHSSVHFPG